MGVSREVIGKGLKVGLGYLDFIFEVMESYVELIFVIFLFYSYMFGFSGGVYLESFEI